MLRKILAQFFVCALFMSAFALQAFSDAPDSLTAHRTSDSIRSVLARQVVVTGTRNTVRLKDSPVRIELIDQQQIKTTSMVALGDLLKEQPGLLLQGGIRSGIQMNGLGPDYTLILIDGQPVIGRIAGVIDLTRMSVGNIERVEVVKGPMSSMYGSEALAGVINIITKTPSGGFTGSALLQALTNGPSEIRTESGFGSSDVEITSFIDYKNSQSFSIQYDTLRFPYSGFQDGTAQAKILWRVDKHWKLRTWLRAFGSESNGEFIESVLGQVATNRGSVRQWDFSANTGVEWTSGRARLNLNTYASSYQERYNFDVTQGSGGSLDDLTRRIVRTYAQYDLLFGESNRMTLGGEFLYDDISGTRYSDTANSRGRPLYRTGVGFAQWEGLPNDWISYVLSLRFDNNNVYGQALSPRFAVLWKPGEHLRLTGAIGTGFKAPDFRQLYINFSNRLPGAGYDLIGAARLGANLEAERSVSYDLGIRYEDGQRDLSADLSILYSASLRLFRNNLFNLIEYYLYGTTNNRSVYSYRNLTRAYTQGIELSLTMATSTSSAGTYSLSASYQFLDAKDVEVLEAIDAGRAGTINEPLSRESYGGLWNRSVHSGTVRIQFDDQDHLWSANIRAQFVGKYGDESIDKNGIVLSQPPRKVLDRPDEYVAGYVVWNTALTRTFGIGTNDLTVGIGINNIADVLNPTLIPGLVGRQYFVQTTFRLN